MVVTWFLVNFGCSGSGAMHYRVFERRYGGDHATMHWRVFVQTSGNFWLGMAWYGISGKLWLQWQWWSIWKKVCRWPDFNGTMLRCTDEYLCRLLAIFGLAWHGTMHCRKEDMAVTKLLADSGSAKSANWLHGDGSDHSVHGLGEPPLSKASKFN